MSYILDALRRADAERDRGNVPGVHAQPSFGSTMPTRAQPAAKPWLWLAAGALAALLIGAVAWYLMVPPRSSIAVVAAPPQTAPTAAAPPPMVTAPAPAAPPVQPVASAVVRKPKPKPALPASAAAPAADAKAPASGEKVYTLAELPDDIRRQLPNVTVGGAMYSSRPADRILIVNGQVLHEGDQVAPGLLLQQIRLKSALMNFKGYRYTIGF